MTQFGSKISATIELAHDLIFPKKCLGCHKFDNFICNDCLEAISVKNNFCCPVCNREMVLPRVCAECAHESELDGLWIVSDYNDELAKQAIHLIKYNYCDEVSEIWNKLIAKYFFQERFWLDDALLLPVPLHRRRYLERGFNQSMIICEIINRIKGNAISDRIIKRKSYGRHQATLDFSERKNNIVGCFQMVVNTDCQKEPGKVIILVDDVYTTGATMAECARTLKMAGFGKIYGFAMARG